MLFTLPQALLACVLVIGAAASDPVTLINTQIEYQTGYYLSGIYGTNEIDTVGFQFKTATHRGASIAVSLCVPGSSYFPVCDTA